MSQRVTQLVCGAVCVLVAEALLVPSAPAQESLPNKYRQQGELIVAQFASAPFPHPKRAEGHRYHDKLYSASEHYSDSTVALFIPRGFRQTGQIDFVVHFHGWLNHVAKVLDRYHLIDQLIASGRNAVLVVPQGPYDAPDSFGGKLEDPDGFKRFMDEVVNTLREKSTLKRKDFQVGKMILSGHSGGYNVISAIVDHGGLTGHVKEVWLFDALYAQTDRFLAWANNGARLIDIYTEHGGTKEETEQLTAMLKKRGTAFVSAKEEEISMPELRTNRWVFIYSGLAHDDVVDKHGTFRQFLETSCLEQSEIRNPNPTQN